MLEKLKIILLLSLLLVFNYTSFIEVSASSSVFSVKPVLKENQVESIENYVHIVQDGTLNDTFSYEITNHSKEEIELEVKALNGLTSPSGIIQYSDKLVLDNAMVIDDTYSFAMYLEEIPTVIVPPESKKTIDIPVHIPEVDGTIIGGISFSMLANNNVVEGADVQFTINNELKTVLGFVVEFGTEITPTILTENPYINPMPSYYVLRLPITNETPNLIEFIDITYKVEDSSGNEIFNSKENKTISMTPKTTINYIIPWDSNKIKQKEEYTVSGYITYKYKNERYEEPFEHKFKFSGQETSYEQSFNEPLEIVKDQTPLIVIIIIIAILIAIVPPLVVIIQSKRKKKRREDIAKQLIAQYNSEDFENFYKNYQYDIHHEEELKRQCVDCTDEMKSQCKDCPLVNQFRLNNEDNSIGESSEEKDKEGTSKEGTSKEGTHK